MTKFQILPPNARKVKCSIFLRLYLGLSSDTFSSWFTNDSFYIRTTSPIRATYAPDSSPLIWTFVNVWWRGFLFHPHGCDQFILPAFRSQTHSTCVLFRWETKFQLYITCKCLVNLHISGEFPKRTTTASLVVSVCSSGRPSVCPHKSTPIASDGETDGFLWRFVFGIFY
jgi:hypothetical protein